MATGRKSWMAGSMALMLMLAACSGGGNDNGGNAVTNGGSGGESTNGSQSTNGGSSGGETVELTLAHYADLTAEQTYKKVAEAFMDTHPNIKVKTEPYTGDFHDVLKTRLATGAGPDVFFLDAFQSAAFIDAERLMPLDDYLGDYDLDDFEENLLQAFQGPDGKQYGIPKDYNTLALFYNKQMLEDAGVEVPTTWDELMAAAKTLTKGNVKGLVLQNELPRFQPFFYSNGGGMLTDGNPAVNSPENAEALKFWLSLFQEDVAATPADLGVGWDGDAFAQGLAAMTIEGNWMSGYVEELAPDLAYGIAPIPISKEQANMIFTVSFSVNSGTKHPAEAAELVKFLTSKEAIAMVADESGGVIPPRKSMKADFQAKFPNRQPFIDAVAVASEFNYGVKSPTVVSQMGNTAEALRLGEETDVQAALDAAQKAIDAAQ